MEIKEISVGSIFTKRARPDKQEILDIIFKARDAAFKGKGIRITEKNEAKRAKLYWRLKNTILRDKMPYTASIKKDVIGVWSNTIKEENAKEVPTWTPAA